MIDLKSSDPNLIKSGSLTGERADLRVSKRGKYAQRAQLETGVVQAF